MNKVVLYSCVFVMLFSCKKENKTQENDSSKATNEWNFFELKGNVKSTFEFTSQSNTEKSSNANSIRKYENQFYNDIALKFDEKGKLIQKISYSEKGTIAEEVTYDGKDKILSVKNYTSPTIYVITKYTWDKNGNNTIISRKFNNTEPLDKEVFHYINGKKIDAYKYNEKDIQTKKTSYIYDKNNRLIEEIYYQNEDTKQSKLFYEYDDKGKKVTEAMYDKFDKLVWKTSFTYNESGFLTNEKTFSSEGKLQYEAFSEYDDKNRVIVKGTFESFDNSSNKEIFEYNENNAITLQKVFKNDKKVSEISYLYDDKKNVILQIIKDDTNKIVYQKEIEYLYDNSLNWINKKTTINGIAWFTSRKIDYY